MDNGELYIVATPIGNLSDITLRALEVLREVDLIACEDKRVTLRLLNHYNIRKPLVSYHQHSRISQVNSILDELKKGKKIALVADAGTPGLSDPGNELVSKVCQADFRVIPIPGPSALTALISVSGINMQKFSFWGFSPTKKGRETFFRKLAECSHPVVYFESPHRLIKNLSFLAEVNPQKNIVIGRELTKYHEEILRGKASQVLQFIVQKKADIRGEIAIIAY